jgi:hypothetical protein
VHGRPSELHHFNRICEEDRMANREQRGNKEKKKPKADKNKQKGGAQPASPFASTRMPPPAHNPGEKKSS